MGALPEPEPVVRDWSELPLDALSLVLGKLGAVEILMGAGLVDSWLDAAKLPELWRCVEMVGRRRTAPEIHKDALCAMAKVGVDRSRRRLEE
ncbi:hypothetical protein BRADI_3g17432v3 [Brachypodium distachyon]|uniref:F-box domain-containing protein n=1 Tax=Brachypodium distachyon TaxID=15368 RepID=A0A0Q3JB06_BRADI|nr:hypothetical protein BRADI_3g17432v3 [Brachypodium distachyon]